VIGSTSVHLPGPGNHVSTHHLPHLTKTPSTHGQFRENNLIVRVGCGDQRNILFTIYVSVGTVQIENWILLAVISVLGIIGLETLWGPDGDPSHALQPVMSS
jgi:hypothetical protein